ncbi:MAG TPA: hypothetical protein VHL58_01860 [Thermoanaerobaculia bacterium]|nr:hypothetical protein [Thermoanaerobaculia bacterium]
MDRKIPVLPIWIKTLFTLYVAFLVPIYWSQSTPMTFLWLCDVALLTTLLSLWLESSLLASMQLLAILLVQVIWQIDFFIQIVSGRKVFGPGVADHVFDPRIPLLNRALSSFHLWLPYLLIWLVWRLGYDRRAPMAQTVYLWAVLLLSYLLTADSSGSAGNLNWVYGFPMIQSPAWAPAWFWLAVLMVFIPLLWYVPLHFIFRRVFRPMVIAPSPHPYP